MIDTRITLLDPAHDADYGSLKGYIIDVTGLAYYSDKDWDFSERISQRLKVLGLADCRTYLNLLKDSAAGSSELDCLVEHLTIGETSFFRHMEVFDGLREQVLPELIRQNRTRKRLRIWSAGCSIGAEPYSLALLLIRHFRREIHGWEVTILGTDINRRFLAQAREGRFTAWNLRGIPPTLIEECFTESGDDYMIRPEYKNIVSFQYHNLVQNTFPSLVNNLVAFDLIFCRNVLIYFDSSTFRRLIEQFHQCLVYGGWLIVGHSEPNIELFRAFDTVNVPGAVLYRKTSKPSIAPPIPTLASQPSHVTANECQKRSASQTETTRPVAVSTTCAESTAIDGLATVRRLADAGLLDEAVDRCQALIRGESSKSSYHVYLAMLLEQLGRRSLCESSLRRAVLLDRDNVLAHYFLGLMQLKQGRLEEARESCLHVVRSLDCLDDSRSIFGAENLTVGELRELAKAQIEVVTIS